MKVAIAAKMSKIEWDMMKTGLDKSGLIESYKKKNLDIQKIVSSHERQKECIGSVYKMIPEAEHIEIGNNAKKEPIDLLFALGGDNFFQRCAFYHPDATLVGVNTDPQTSSGVLLYFNQKSLERNIGKILSGEFEVERWTKVKTKINSKDIEDAVCTASVRAEDGEQMCRYYLESEHLEIHEEQKSSGLLVVSGAGSCEGAWYRNAGLYLPRVALRYYRETTKEFPKTDRMIKALAREVYGGEECRYRLLNPTIYEGKKLLLSFLATNSDGVVSIDSIKSYPIKEGDVVEFSVSKNVLNVLYVPQPY